MKQTTVFFLLLFSLLVALGCGTADNPITNDDENREQIGTLKVDIEKIDGVSIHLRLYQDGQLIAQSGGNGSYEINELVAGNYTLHISADGYQDIERNVTIIAGETVSVDSVELIKYEDGSVPGEGLKIGGTAPDFELSDGNGNIHSLSEYLGKDKMVVIVFYRTGG